MKVKFKFKIGDEVVCKNGLEGTIAILGVTDAGVSYLVRGPYAEQWIVESGVKLASGGEPSEEKD